MTGRKFRYCVLYVRDAEHQKLMGVLEKHMPDGRGEAFYPCMEYYRRDDKEVKIKAIFPGYVFLYTDMDMKEVHGLLRNHRGEMDSAVRELALSERRSVEPDVLYGGPHNEELFDLSDVGEEEEGFLDYLREGDGLLTMSSGYEYEDERKGRKDKSRKRYAVMEGPLKVYEDKIIKVDKHNRRAFLEFEINGRRAQAGFSCLPRAHWFPNEHSNIVKFQDGTEADLGELKNRIMALK